MHEDGGFKAILEKNATALFWSRPREGGFCFEVTKPQGPEATVNASLFMSALLTLDLDEMQPKVLSTWFRNCNVTT
jgi:hypothetical protein